MLGVAERPHTHHRGLTNYKLIYINLLSKMGKETFLVQLDTESALFKTQNFIFINFILFNSLRP